MLESGPIEGKSTTLTLAFNPNLQMASQSALDCSEAAGEVNSICKALISIMFPCSGHLFLDDSRSLHRNHPMPWQSQSSSRYQRKHWRIVHLLSGYFQ